MRTQALNNVSRKVPEGERIKVTRYKSVLRVSKATDLPKLGSGNDAGDPDSLAALEESLLSAELTDGGDVATGLVGAERRWCSLRPMIWIALWF